MAEAYTWPIRTIQPLAYHLWWLKFLSLTFVKINEISSDETLPDTPGCAGPQSLPITDILQWIETLSVMVVILSQRFPEKAPELFAYITHRLL